MVGNLVIGGVDVVICSIEGAGVMAWTEAYLQALGDGGGSRAWRHRIHKRNRGGIVVDLKQRDVEEYGIQARILTS